MDSRIWSAVLVQTKGLGSSFQVSIQARMSALSCADGAVRAAAELLGGQLGEPALDEVQPGARGRGEVQHEPRVGGQPLVDRRRLVGRAVVEDDVDVEIGRDLAIEGLQELLELDRAVAAVQRADDLAGGDVQRGVEARGAVAFVVVGRALGHARAASAGSARCDRAPGSGTSRPRRARPRARAG